MAIKMFDGINVININVTATFVHGVTPTSDTDETPINLISGKVEFDENIEIGISTHNIKERIMKALQVSTDDSEALSAQYVRNIATANWQAIGTDRLQKCFIDASSIVTLSVNKTDGDVTLEIPTKVQQARKVIKYELAEINMDQKVMGQPKTIEASSELKADAIIKADPKYRDYKDAKYVLDMFNLDVRMKRGVNSTILRVTKTEEITKE